ncbi:ExbD/TolR family protein [Xylella taiwanensis]|uniref:Tol-Pal system protein TolR n=1 Tax=Xylella taiwanensis TaxID=1444770 RepID=Z9JGG4_9GAMM|nr:ExbD/TolR family protein [Xylella taiwanensis]AXI83554.1 biopolymer transporter TolR [Xylella taiwanensis]EWS77284.1 biopolymer transporter TolR [Xylella taiwanensis]MCD8456629.1 ExbD/TolR family protein [Xylella taiwanensis]MCD8459036.1 ExbD/TolR family protein [Xylella taiwanensis]MCD8461174.1 ExbD/TolR family protein [Xylella taiwanensis]
MFSISHRKRRKLKAEINVVPYIDVMLVLLVIFMVTAPLLTLSINVDLPVSKAKALESKQDPIVVIVNGDDTFGLQLPRNKSLEKIDNDKLLSNRLAAMVLQDKNVRVVVAAGRSVAYKNVITAMNAIQDAKVEKVSLLTRPPGTNAH